MPTWTSTDNGRKSLNTVQFGFPHPLLSIGFRIVSADGFGLSLGDGRGWKMNLGAFVPSYGRWVRIGQAWGWLPGPYVAMPVYAPALVAFVGGPHFSISVGVGGAGLAAWFPLGPGEPFFPWYHCREEYRRAVNITNIRIITSFTNITNITNISDVR